jgi:testis-specific serine kinase
MKEQDLLKLKPEIVKGISALERRGYNFNEILGRGAYSKVFTVSFENKTTGLSQNFACKSILPSTDEEKKFTSREIEILQKTTHPNIVFIDSIFRCGPATFILMRKAENGDLLRFIKKQKQVREPQAKFWFKQLVSAVKYLHSIGYTHRDLKCENVLITKNMNVLITDFGFSRPLVDENGDDLLSTTFCGSLRKYFEHFHYTT